MKTPQRLAEILGSVNSAVVGEQLADVCHQAANELRRRQLFSAQLRDVQEKLSALAQCVHLLRKLSDPDADIRPPRTRHDGITEQELIADRDEYLGRNSSSDALAHNKSASEQGGASA